MTNEEMNQCICEYGKDILRFCRMTTGSLLEGDELYQDTMLKLWEQREKLNPDQNIKSYALSVSILLWKNKRRKFAWRKRIASVESYEVYRANGFDISDQRNEVNPEEKILQDEMIQMVRNVVASLPEKYRTVVYLYYSASLTVREIASCVKIPEGTVKSRLRKAKNEIRQRLEVAENDR